LSVEISGLALTKIVAYVEDPGTMARILVFEEQYEQGYPQLLWET
jgi:hypothetical protein